MSEELRRRSKGNGRELKGAVELVRRSERSGNQTMWVSVTIRRSFFFTRGEMFQK